MAESLLGETMLDSFVFLTVLHNRFQRYIAAFNLACLIYSIIALEFTLVWNSISEIYTIRNTGQLIPFIIGIVGLIRVTIAISLDYATKRLKHSLVRRSSPVFALRPILPADDLG